MSEALRLSADNMIYDMGDYYIVWPELDDTSFSIVIILLNH